MEDFDDKYMEWNEPVCNNYSHFEEDINRNPKNMETTPLSNDGMKSQYKLKKNSLREESNQEVSVRLTKIHEDDSP